MARFQEGILLDWVHIARQFTKVSLSRTANKHLSLPASLKVAMIPVRDRAYVFLSMADHKTLRLIDWYCAAIYFV